MSTALQEFVRAHCAGAQYDSCVSSPCKHASPDGCAHPLHPKHDTHDFRDRGNPMEKEHPRSSWQSWERRPEMDRQPGLLGGR